MTKGLRLQHLLTHTLRLAVISTTTFIPNCSFVVLYPPDKSKDKPLLEHPYVMAFRKSVTVATVEFVTASFK